MGLTEPLDQAPDDDGGDGRWQQNLVRPCLLLLVAQRRSHGYDLLGRLRALGIDVAERSVYRNLDILRRRDLITSDWETPSAGPARRVYQVTRAGLEEIERAAVELRRHLSQLRDLVVEFERVAPGPKLGDRRRWRSGRRAEAVSG